ncbi:MAG: dihydroneopterin aldolase [Bacteroidia bacterium]|nr:dihydroneopterin aldolase [Bacteroidia bacterium]MCZ2247509.1 dihydroneopterin aldolase [Bacteroidia bacterium]
MHKIHINTIKLYAYHGCLPEEALVGSPYTVDIILETDFSKAILSDNLEDTVDYCSVFNVVKEEMAVRAKLLENVAFRIIKRLKNEHPLIHKCTVTITKVNPPMNGNVLGVSVIIEE